MSKPKKRKSKFGKVMFVIEILLLMLVLGGLYIWGQVNQRLEILEEPAQEFEPERIVVNPEVETVSGYRTYALFGIDHRDKNPELGSENSDTIIVASVNFDTKDVKLVSLYRDTLLNIGDGVYSKANAAYAYGGPEQAISMLNKNLDLSIEDYITVDFNALVTAIDCVGGLDIPMSYAELVHMNNYCVETSEEVEKDYTPIELPERPEDIEAVIGTYHLNGVQGTSYCRIRYTADLDMGRTVRQRRTIQMIVAKARTGGLGMILRMMDEIFPQVKTSLTKNEILQLLPMMIGFSMNDTVGFPMKFKFADVNRASMIVPTNLVSNVEELHKFLYGESHPYNVSAEVKEYGSKIIEIAGGEENLENEKKETTDNEENNNDTFIWYESTGSTSSPAGDNDWNNNSSGGNDYYNGNNNSGGNDYYNGNNNSGGNDYYNGNNNSGGNDYYYGDNNSGGYDDSDYTDNSGVGDFEADTDSSVNDSYIGEEADYGTYSDNDASGAGSEADFADAGEE